MRDYLVVVGVAFATVVVATPAARWVAHRIGAVAQPGERHIHTTPTPRLGGLALFAGVVAGIGVASQLPTFADIFATTSEPEAIILAAAFVVGLGLIDDIRGLSAPAKLAGQLVSSGLLVLFGVLLRFVWIPGNPGTVVFLAPDLSALVTILAIVAMINAVNLVDGLDGLAAGIVAIAAGSLLVYVQLADTLKLAVPIAAPLLLTALVGACAAFLLYNFHPASIFMGDTGAMLLGLLLGAAAISALQPIVQPTRGDIAAVATPVLVPALVLAVPFLDTTSTILRRLLTGRAVFSPDKRHLHHRLVEIGHSHRRAVLIMYYWSALLAFGGVALSLLPLRTVLTVLTVGAGLPLVFAAVPRVARWRTRRRPEPSKRAEKFVLSFTKSTRSPGKHAADQRKRVDRPL